MPSTLRAEGVLARVQGLSDGPGDRPHDGRRAIWLGQGESTGGGCVGDAAHAPVRAAYATVSMSGERVADGMASREPWRTDAFWSLFLSDEL